MIQAVDGTKGGTLVGDPHSAPTGGIHTLNVDTKETLLVEGREVVINKDAANLPGVRTYTGTNKQILSQVNQSAGDGVPILQNGGELPPTNIPVAASQIAQPQITPVQSSVQQEDYFESYWGNPLLDYIFAVN